MSATQPKNFTRAEIEGMSWSKLLELANSGSDDVNRIGWDDVREIAFAELVLNQEAANAAQQAAAEEEAKLGKMSKAELRKVVDALSAQASDVAQIETDLQSVADEPFESMSAAQIRQAFADAERNQRLIDAGQADVLDNSAGHGDTARANDSLYNQAREDSEYVLRASDEALDSVLREKHGLSSAEVAQLKEANAIAQSEAIQEQFLSRHPEFIANSRNASLLTDHIKARGHEEFTAENLEAAFADLKDVVSGSTRSTPDAQPRRSTSKSSTVVGRSGAPQRPRGYTEAQLREMPMDKLREVCNAQMAAANREAF